MTKVRITPIGTCRIHTPLRRAAGRYPIEIDHRRNYGFVHTSDEALQLVRFLQGEKHFQPQVAKLVARDGDLDQYRDQQWEPSDLHIVEISSAKRITSGPDTVQGNYLAHHFADFFASYERSRTFWSLVKKAHRRDLVGYLRRQESYRLLRPDDRELLSSLQMELQSFKSIKTDMAEIVDRLGAERLLFVTHVNAAGPDGETIPLRDRLIRWVKLASEQLGVPVFDPTAAMKDFGQAKALEAGGTDLTHYTPAFYDRVYEEIHRAHVVPLTGALPGPDSGSAGEDPVARRAAMLHAMLETGDFLTAARDIHAAVDDSPGTLDFVELRGLVRSRIGDFEGAVADFTARGDDSALSQAMRVALVEALTATGDHERALAVAENLFAEEHENAELYRVAAQAARTVGRFGQAISHAKQAFRRDRSDLQIALDALILLSEHGSAEETAAWRREILENIGESANGALEVSLWAIRNGDDELFATALKLVATIDKPGAIDLLEDSLEAGLDVGAASSIETAVDLGRLSRTLSERRLAVMNALLDKAESLAAEGRPAEAYRLASAFVPLAEVNSRQIPGRKLASRARKLAAEASKQIRLTIRDAYKANDEDEVLRIGSATGTLLLSLPDAASVYARTLHSRDRTEEALEFLKRCLEIDPDSFILHRWTARFAAIAGDYVTALREYGGLRRSEDPEAQRIETEVDRFFASVESRAIKDLRRLVVSGSYDEAVELGQLIVQEVGSRERVKRELDRMHSLIRTRLKEIDEGEGEGGEREALLRRLAELRPDDLRNLRRLAVHLMNQKRFAEASEIWAEISTRDRSDETAARQRDRCIKMAERRTEISAGIDAAA